MVLIHNFYLDNYHTKNYKWCKVCSRNKPLQLNLKKKNKSESAWQIIWPLNTKQFLRSNWQEKPFNHWRICILWQSYCPAHRFNITQAMAVFRRAESPLAKRNIW